MKPSISIFFISLLVVFVLWKTCRAQTVSSDSISDAINLQSGSVSGTKTENGIFVYKGIPYAAPPVGSLRWKPPFPVSPWSGVRRCLSYGPACVQPKVSSIFSRKYAQVSEDCLYLNVWTPVKPNTSGKLPVLFWIHGGAFMTGSASDDFYDAQELAQKGVVVVTFNYRLGPLGFLAHPLLSKESPHNVSGNYGLLDQIEALKWVRDNIVSFGGDPSKVTILGESAGGRSVAFLMVSPLAKGLFHRAIMQSSSIYRPIQHVRESWYGRSSMEAIGQKVARAMDADDKSDTILFLRSQRAEDIIEASKPKLAGMKADEEEGSPYEPIVDGWVIPDDPSDMFDAGQQHNVPVIVGTNADESSLFTNSMRFMRAGRIRETIRDIFPDFANEILQVYPMDDKESALNSINRILNDMNCNSPMRNIARNTVKIGANAWRYHFTRVRSDFMGKRFGAWHGSEIRFIFNSLNMAFTKPDNIDRSLSEIMSNYWVRFAQTGNPNAPGLPDWPNYVIALDPYIEFGDQINVKQHLNPVSTDLFQRIEKHRRLSKKNPVILKILNK